MKKYLAIIVAVIMTCFANSFNTFCQDTSDLTFGVVTISVANGRSEASDRAELTTQMLLGTPVKILQARSWYFVESPEGYASWVSPGSIKRMDKNTFNRWVKAPKIMITKHYGSSVKEPNENAAFVSDIVFGNLFETTGESGDYFKVVYPDGREAFVEKKLAQPLEQWLDSILLTEESLVEKGWTLLGLPYFWGANTTKAVDCSGFVKTTYFMHGVILRRDSYQMVETGQAIDISNGYDDLRPGDLLFFRRDNETGNNQYRIRHVAMYIGNKAFLQAGNPVKVSSFDPAAPNYDSYNTRTLIRATRILGQIDTPGITTIKSNPFYQIQE